MTTTKANPVNAFKETLGALLTRGDIVLPDNVPQDAFRNAAIVAIQDNPDLLGADHQSLFKSIRRAAASGLVPDGREGALVTFKVKDKATDSWRSVVQFMPMVFGLMKMARRSGTIREIRAHIVYQNEVDQGRFTYIVGDEERLEHAPILFEEKGAPVAAYAIATMMDGSIIREFMSAAEIDTVRRAASSQRVYASGQSPRVSDTPIGIWKDWWPEMWKKTVIRRITKRLDLSADDVRRIQEDDDFVAGMRDVTPTRKAGGFVTKAKAARGEVVPSDPIDQTPPHWTEGVAWDEAQIGSSAWDEGVQAFQSGQAVADCPYDGDPGKAADWIGGWHGAKQATA
jgi:recombination protein RecT